MKTITVPIYIRNKNDFNSHSTLIPKFLRKDLILNVNVQHRSVQRAENIQHSLKYTSSPSCSCSTKSNYTKYEIHTITLVIATKSKSQPTKLCN